MRQYSGTTYLKVADVKESGPRRVTIVDVTLGKFDKPDIEFDDGSKMGINATNNRVLCNAYGVDSDDWPDKQVELYVGTVDFKGKDTESVLIKPISPAVEKKAPPKPAKDLGDDMADEIPF